MRALVLSGGGSKGAFQVGVLKRWMGEQGVDYDIMCGVSVGALNVAGLACTPKGKPELAIKWLEDFWLTKVKGNESVYKRWWPFGRWHSLWKRSVYDSSPLSKLIRSYVDPAKIKEGGRLVAAGAVCLDTGKLSFGYGSDPQFVDWTLASSSFPIFFEPVEIDGALYSDGGIANITPLGQAIRMGAKEIDVIVCSDPWAVNPWTSERKVAVPDQIIRTLSIMSDQISRCDIEETGLKNDLSDASDKYRRVRVRVVVPSKPLGVDSLEFDPLAIRRMIHQGYYDAEKFSVYE